MQQYNNALEMRRKRQQQLSTIMECWGVSTKIQLAIYLVVMLKEEVYPTRN
jgi:hypothetical protein